MNCTQVTACKPTFNVLQIPHPWHYAASAISVVPVNVIRLSKDSAYHFGRVPEVSRRMITSATRIQQCTPVCLFGGKGKSGNDNDASPWKSLEKAMSSFKKESSLEDVLRQQMEKKEFYDDGGSGGKRPGGGGGGGGDGFGEPDDEGLPGILDEVLQVFMATVGIIVVYIYIIAGEEMIVFVKDVIKFLFTRQGSSRLNQIFYQWGSFYQSLNTKEDDDPYWLEKEIIGTPTWWDSPARYKSILKAYMALRSSHSDSDSD